MWQWVKVTKGVALVAFFLPWMTVSCSATELVRASGWDLAIGRPKLTPQLAQIAGEQVAQGGGHLSVWLLLALALVAIGLVLSFRGARAGAAAVVATSIGAALLSWVGTRQLGSELFARAASRSEGSGIDRALAAQIRVDWQFGYWLFLLALIAAAVLAGMSLARRNGAVP